MSDVEKMATLLGVPVMPAGLTPEEAAEWGKHALEHRPLSCGWCFEENGEEVHPHPECPEDSDG